MHLINYKLPPNNHLSLMNTCITAILVLLIITTTTSCDEQQHKHGNSEKVDDYYLTATIHTEAGAAIAVNGTFDLPAFFNVGKLDSNTKDLSVLVLGPRISKNKSVKIAPLAVLSFDQDSVKRQYLISKSELAGDMFGKDYLSFMSRNNELAEAIESWFKAQCSFSVCRNYNWQNPNSILLELQNIRQQ